MGIVIYMQQMLRFYSSYRSRHCSRVVRSGFTLIELMVVILIIGILSGVVLTAMTGSDDSRALDSGITRLDSLFSLARSAAISRKQPTRLLINFDDSDLSDPQQPQRLLRYATIVFLDDDGDWKVYTEGEFLPEKIYFSPGLSTASDPLYTWTININPTTLAVTQPPNGDLSAASPYQLIGNTDNLQHGPGPNKWFVYEFSANGTFSNPGARVVLASAIVNNPPSLTIPVEVGAELMDIVKGFVVFRSGKVMHFRSGEQIEEGN